MESMIQDMLPVDLPSGADGVEPKPRGERHMSNVEAAAARRIGCAPAHLSQILRGVRKSHRTMELLRKNHVKIEVAG